MHGVIIAAQLCLAPEGCSKLIQTAPAHDDAQHVVLDVGAHHHQLVAVHLGVPQQSLNGSCS